MRKYDVALSAVECFYSIELADGPNFVAFFEGTMRATPSYGHRVMTELSESLSDVDFSWKDALWSEECHIEEFDSELAARAFVEGEVLPVVVRAIRYV